MVAVFYLLSGLLGVTLIIFINWRLSGFQQATLGCADCALRELQAEDPAFSARDVALTADKHAALALSGEETLHLVRAQGDKFVIRKLDPSSLAVTRNGAVLRLHAANDMMDDAELVFSSQDVAGLWAARLGSGAKIS